MLEGINPNLLIAIGIGVLALGVGLLIYAYLNYTKIRKFKEFLESKLRNYTHLIITDFSSVYIFHNVIVDAKNITALEENKVYEFTIPHEILAIIEEDQKKKKTKEVKAMLLPTDFVLEFAYPVEKEGEEYLEKIGLMFGVVDDKAEKIMPILPPNVVYDLLKNGKMISELMKIISLLYDTKFKASFEVYKENVEVIKKLFNSADFTEIVESVAYLCAINDHYFNTFALAYGRYSGNQISPKILKQEILEAKNKIIDQFKYLINLLPPEERVSLAKIIEKVEESSQEEIMEEYE